MIFELSIVINRFRVIRIGSKRENTTPHGGAVDLNFKFQNPVIHFIEYFCGKSINF